MDKTIAIYNQSFSQKEFDLTNAIAAFIDEMIPNAQSKIWHSHPVWFIDENPIVGYSKLKSGWRLMFWSGASFDEPQLLPGTGKFKDASIIYQQLEEVNFEDVKRWLIKAQEIQWDYKNIVKRKGQLIRLK